MFVNLFLIWTVTICVGVKKYITRQCSRVEGESSSVFNWHDDECDECDGVKSRPVVNPQSCCWSAAQTNNITVNIICRQIKYASGPTAGYSKSELLHQTHILLHENLEEYNLKSF